MAKHPRKRRPKGRYLKGQVDEGKSLSTLAAVTLLSDTFDESVEERTRISSLVATWSLTDFTSSAASGPVVVGVAHSDYSDAEIEAYIEVTTSWKEGDLVAQEIGQRKIRKIGVFADDGSSALDTVVLNDGKPIHTKLNWILTTGKTLKMWAYNQGSQPLVTGSILQCQGHANLWVL